MLATGKAHGIALLEARQAKEREVLVHELGALLLVHLGIHARGDVFCDG